MIMVDQVSVNGAGEVVIAHHDQVVRFGLWSMLADRAGYVECAADAAELDRRVCEHRPHVVIVSGAVLEEQPSVLDRASSVEPPKVLLVIRDSDLQRSGAMVPDPVDGLLLEEEITEVFLVAALRSVRSGGFPAPSRVVRRLLGDVRCPSTSGRTEPPTRLTPREHEVLRHLSEGLTNRQIARRLDLSEHGAKRHVANVLAKLNCRNRTSAATRALSEGLVDLVAPSPTSPYALGT